MNGKAVREEEGGTVWLEGRKRNDDIAILTKV